MDILPDRWKTFLDGDLDQEKLSSTLEKLHSRRSQGEVYPPTGSVFAAFELTPPENVRAVILGQDPYHGENEANGLAFSVNEGVKMPPSLRNIYKEFAADLQCSIPQSTDLSAWAKAGVLLMNAVLSVDRDHANSHAKLLGWEFFTDSVIRALSRKRSGIAFVLWGNFAGSKRCLIDEEKHLVIASAHPSPLSARRGFFGSRPFSAVSEYTGLDWPVPGR